MAAVKLREYTNGTHIYMRLRLDSGRIEEIDVYLREYGITCRTSADHCPGDHPDDLRNQIISAFNELY